MTKLDKYLKELEERLNAATEGPWKVVGNDNWKLKGFPQIEMSDENLTYFPVDCNKNAKFIAHSRTDVEVLLKIIAILERQRDQYIAVACGCLEKDEDYEKQLTKSLNKTLEYLIPEESEGEE